MYDDSGEAPSVDTRDIDSRWLQKKVWQAHETKPRLTGSKPRISPIKSSRQWLTVTATTEMSRIASPRLFDYDKFGLIIILLHNRLKVVCCTRFTMAQEDPQQWHMIVVQGMASDPSLAPILNPLVVWYMQCSQSRASDPKITSLEALTSRFS